MARTQDKNLQAVAQSYNEKWGLEPIVEGHYAPLDTELSTRIARAYEQLPLLDTRPLVTRSYNRLAYEIMRQFNHLLDNGYIFEAWTKEGQPYATSQEMQADVMNNKHIYFFQGGEPNPAMSEVVYNGWTINDVFRAVHDVFGHAVEGFQFGARGEENAWIHHSMMFSPLAQLALTTETRGQNSWVNFGPNKDLPVTERPFATQKQALLHLEYCDYRKALAR